jgi:hypothetical protein
MMFGLAGLAAMLYAISGTSAFEPGRVIVLLALAAASARAKVNLYRGSSISLLTSVVMIAVMTEGPAVAMLVGICGVTVQTVFPLRKKLVLYQVVFNTSMIALTVAATFGTYHSLAGTKVMEALSAEVTATVLASFVYFLGNSLSVSLIIAFTKGMSMLKIWTQHFMWSAPSFLIAGILSIAVIGLTGSHFLPIAGVLVAAVGFAYYCSIRLTARPSADTRKSDVSTAA